MKETISAVDRLTGCVEVALRKVKCQTKRILKSKSTPCQISSLLGRQVLNVFVLIILSPASLIFGISYLSSVEKGKKFLPFKCVTVM